MHAYQCMWHRPRCTKICSVRKFANAWVRKFYANDNFYDYSTVDETKFRVLQNSPAIQPKAILGKRWAGMNGRRGTKLRKSITSETKFTLVFTTTLNKRCVDVVLPHQFQGWHSVMNWSAKSILHFAFPLKKNKFETDFQTDATT